MTSAGTHLLDGLVWAMWVSSGVLLLAEENVKFACVLVVIYGLKNKVILSVDKLSFWHNFSQAVWGNDELVYA